MQFETLAVHGGYTPEPTTQGRGRAALPDSGLLVRQRPARRRPVRPEGGGQHLHPHHEPHHRRAGKARRGAGRRRGRAGHGLGHGGHHGYAIQTIAETGDNIISASTLYGGTYNLFAHTFPQQGIEVRFADPRDPASFAKLIDARTKAVYCESIGNPLGNVTDIAALAKVAHDHGVPLIVDNTVPSPYLCRPIEHGADIVVHALTKYMNGHGNSIGGIIVDSGKFPWAQHKERFKRLNEPDVSYHGVVYTEALGPAAFIGRARVVPLRNMGAALSPFNAWLTLQGIETLPLRMDRICDNTLALAKTLQAHPKVEWVRYAGLPDHADHAVVQRQMGGRASGILSFGLKSSDADPRAAGARFLDALQLFTRLVNIGDAKSLATHPASTTHRQLNPEELAKAGVSENMVRLSVGIEHRPDRRSGSGFGSSVKITLRDRPRATRSELCSVLNLCETLRDRPRATRSELCSVLN
jgi:O-acetylhomoserine (thiol)-lyase